jgi:ketosteroid isomerase-like protein
MRNCSVNAASVVVACALLCIVGGLWAAELSQSTPMKNHGNVLTKDDATRAAVELFNQVFNRHDAEAVAALLTEDTVFEDTSPAPDGRRIEGKAAVADFWRAWFAHNPDARFEAEEIISSGDRATVLWVYRKMRNGQPWHLRGVDIFTVRDGKIAAKLAYVKG